MSEDFFEVVLPPAPFAVVWNTPGNKVYHSGISRGMLYIDELDGVPWVGLVSVDRRSLGGTIKPFYLDGRRMRNDQASSEFAAAIETYTYPDEFSVCLGEKQLAPGLFLANQHREQFAMTYRTNIGSDIDDLGSEYQIHFIYEATANPTSTKNTTRTDAVSPETMSIDIEALPQTTYDHVPTAYFRLDTRYTARDRVRTIEYILYGSETAKPRMPSIEELTYILTYEEPEIVEEIPWDPIEELKTNP